MFISIQQLRKSIQKTLGPQINNQTFSFYPVIHTWRSWQLSTALPKLLSSCQPGWVSPSRMEAPSVGGSLLRMLWGWFWNTRWPNLAASWPSGWTAATRTMSPPPWLRWGVWLRRHPWWSTLTRGRCGMGRRGCGGGREANGWSISKTGWAISVNESSHFFLKIVFGSYLISALLAVPKLSF